MLVRFKYYQLRRVEKGVIRRYLEKVSGYSRAQVSRLIREYNQRGQLRKAQYRRHRFPGSYTTADIANQMSDNEYAERMMKARSNPFQHVSQWAERVARGYSPSTPPNCPPGKEGQPEEEKSYCYLSMLIFRLEKTALRALGSLFGVASFFHRRPIVSHTTPQPRVQYVSDCITQHVHTINGNGQSQPGPNS